MKEPNITKEQLLIEMTRFKDSNERWAKQDEERRKEFAKAFLWYDENNFSYSRGMEIKNPTWAEIFIKVGGLLEIKRSAMERCELESFKNENEKLIIKLLKKEENEQTNTI